jgi:hypothetical protein
MLRELYEDPKAFWRKYQAKDGRAEAAGGLGDWTQHFRKVFEGNRAGAYVGGSFEAHCGHFDYLFPECTDERLKVQAAALNAAFTDAELQSVLPRLLSHKAAGVDGVPGEFFSQAFCFLEGGEGRSYALGPVLASLFTSVLHGGYPEVWCTSALAPVPKPRGRPDVMDDYRGIAVSAVVAKLFSLCLYVRMDKWAEGGGFRARGQAGFRPGRGTADNCFVLRHLIDAAALQQRPLYVAYIDFSKAYDRVDRRLLWRVLEGFGVHGEALCALQRMHACVQMRVRLGGKLGEPFEAATGVKQGDPLSPLLFGLLIDRLEAWLAVKCPEAGADLAGTLVRALLYADDVALVSDSVEGLRSMLAALAEFCTANSMFVNAKKSEVVVYNSKYHRGPYGAFVCGEAVLERKQCYTYLGLCFADGVPCKRQLDRGVDRARTAMHTMFGQCYKLGLRNCNVQGHLFDALVKPVLCYGCEVWGPDWVSAACRTGDFGSGIAEKEVQRVFVRQSIGCADNTKSAILMRELNRLPFMCFWVRMAAQLWNKGLAQGGGELLGMAMRHGVSMMAGRSTAQKRQLWAFHFTQSLEHLGVPWSGQDGALLPVNIPNLKRVLQAKWEGFEWGAADSAHMYDWFEADSAVRAAPDSFSRGFRGLVYRHWFQADEWVRKETWAYHLTSHRHIRAVGRFRCGSHWLGVRTGRFGAHRQQRSERLCGRCDLGRVDDEMHLMECPCFEGLRAQYHSVCTAPAGGWTDASFRQRMNFKSKQNWEDWAGFLIDCEELASGLL